MNGNDIAKSDIAKTDTTKEAMMKKQSNSSPTIEVLDVEIGRGAIKDNALKALVTSQRFKMQVVKSKKGKGSFNRKAKHRGKEPYSKAA